jgi:hypothetical protein
MKKFTVAMMILTMASVASAKLPALSDEAKAKAEETKLKTAWSDKVGAYKLCLSQDKVAAHYRKTIGKDAKPATATPPCQDPGPYAAAGAAAATPVPVAAPAVTAASTVQKKK